MSPPKAPMSDHAAAVLLAGALVGGVSVVAGVAVLVGASAGAILVVTGLTAMLLVFALASV